MVPESTQKAERLRQESAEIRTRLDVNGKIRGRLDESTAAASGDARDVRLLAADSMLIKPTMSQAPPAHGTSSSHGIPYSMSFRTAFLGL